MKNTRKWTLLIFILIFLLGACENFIDQDDPDPVNDQEPALFTLEDHSIWFTRQIIDMETETNLNIIQLKKTDENLYQLFLERYIGSLSDNITNGYLKFDFRDRYYLELEDTGNGEELSITGIKDSNETLSTYERPGEEGFNTLLDALGWGLIALTHHEEDSFCSLRVDSEEWARLEREWISDESAVMDIERDGNTYSADVRERIWYIPMGDSFRMVYRREYSYTREDSSVYSGYFHIDTYGTRTFNGELDLYMCEIDSYSNTGAYPLLLVYPSNPLFEIQLGKLGFTSFQEISSENDKILSIELD